MKALFRIAAIAIAGAGLYYAGLLNSIIQTRPERPGAPAVVFGIAIALVVIVAALRGTGRGDARTPPRYVRVHRVAWLFVCVMAIVSTAWLLTVPRVHPDEWTPYHNDAIALNECAARELLAGRNPYVSLDIFHCYRAFGIGADRTTPLQRGLFADVPIYPDDAELDAAWALREREGGNVEFVTDLSYPALSFVPLVPFVALGVDTNLAYLACLLVAIGLVVWRSERGLRAFVLTGVFGAASVVAFTVGGSADLLYALPLVVAWIWRERRLGALALGAAAATKQLAWFVAPFWLIAVVASRGWRAAARQSALAALVFGLTNLPFVVADPRAWLTGVLTPITAPMFARGAGLVFLSTDGPLPLAPATLYLALEAIAGIVCLAVAWRARRSSPELGIVLAFVPLFFAWRSLFSYFFLLPLFAYAGLVRMPFGPLTAAEARDAGAVTLFAMPPGPRPVRAARTRVA